MDFKESIKGVSITCIGRLRAKENAKQDLGRDENSVCIINDEGQPEKWYDFDYVFNDVDSTTDLFDQCFRNYLNSLINGINVSIFMYGASDTGKEYTLRDNEKELGLISQIADGVFTAMKSKKAKDPTFDFKIRVKYSQIYSEEIKDLLGQENETYANDKIVIDQWEGAVVQPIKWTNA